jgi:predicted nuclease with TOPRIM domain
MPDLRLLMCETSVTANRADGLSLEESRALIRDLHDVRTQLKQSREHTEGLERELSALRRGGGSKGGDEDALRSQIASLEREKQWQVKSLESRLRDKSKELEDARRREDQLASSIKSTTGDLSMWSGLPSELRAAPGDTSVSISVRDPSLESLHRLVECIHHSLLPFCMVTSLLPSSCLPSQESSSRLEISCPNP